MPTRPRPPGPPSASGLSRRSLLRGAGAGALLLLSPLSGRALARGGRRLAFENLHTGERLSLVYRAEGRYLPDALSRVDHHLRDHRTDDVHPIDPSLLDLLYALRVETGARSPFQVISGYRSPRTNAMLRGQGGGVARRSLHLEGKAVDLRLADVPSRRLRRAAIALRRGGVGYYPESDFVHVDVGRVRTW